MLKMKIYCECDFCGEMEEVKGIRKICPWQGKNCQGNIFNIYRIECSECDYADDWFPNFNQWGCPDCQEFQQMEVVN